MPYAANFCLSYAFRFRFLRLLCHNHDVKNDECMFRPLKKLHVSFFYDMCLFKVDRIDETQYFRICSISYPSRRDLHVIHARISVFLCVAPRSNALNYWSTDKCSFSTYCAEHRFSTTKSFYSSARPLKSACLFLVGVFAYTAILLWYERVAYLLFVRDI